MANRDTEVTVRYNFSKEDHIALEVRARDFVAQVRDDGTATVETNGIIYRTDPAALYKFKTELPYAGDMSEDAANYSQMLIKGRVTYKVEANALNNIPEIPRSRRQRLR